MILSIKELSKAYGKNQALSCFSADFQPGIYALLGPNGAGKSTLMNIITDNLKADSGEITFGDDGKEPENIKKMGTEFRKKLGFMPQYPGLYPNFTVESFMWYMATLKDMGRGLGGKERKQYIAKQINEILVAVELDDVSKRRIDALSGGMKQRLTLAQAVLGSPSVLILDEPTAGLDPKQRIAIRNYISQIALNKIVIIATHVVSDVEFIARDIIMLKNGVIIEKAPPHELIKKIDDNVWSIPVGESEVSSMQEKHRVINIARDEDDPQTVRLRVISDVRPTETAINVPSTLEDYYLCVFNDVGSA